MDEEILSLTTDSILVVGEFSLCGENLDISIAE
jgi:hypothetical protein